MSKKYNLKSNIWKFFIFNLSQRRLYIPILAIYFLTLPNSNAQQIGLFSAIGFLTSFLFEIPSGYFSDKFGHKKTLVLSKILMILSSCLFIFFGNLFGFIGGSMVLSLSFAFSSGSMSAFMHETLTGLGREDQFGKIMSKFSANVSLASVPLILLLPVFTTISIVFPIIINLFIDFIGLLFVSLLISPNAEEEISSKINLTFLQTMISSVNPGFYYVSIFFGIMSGFIIGISAFRAVYLESIGYPIIFIGGVVGLSRLIWFLIGNKIAYIEKRIGIDSIIKLEIVIFPIFFIMISYFSNPYFVGFLFSLLVGYFWSRNMLITNLFLAKFIKDKKLKATMLSVKKQISLIIQVAVSFLIGFIMNVSFELGFLVVGISMFILLISIYPKIKIFIKI